MYAIIRTGGKQYKVQPGDIVQVEKIDKDLGSEFDLTDILLVGGDTVTIGKPTVQNAKVTVVITKQARAPKIIVFKKKRRQGYRKTQGHRQYFTELFIKAITSPDGKTATTQSAPNIVDVVAQRQNRIVEKVEARKERAQAAVGGGTSAKAAAPKAAKKKAVKAAPKKAAKKKTAKKSSAKKKTVKKASKK